MCLFFLVIFALLTGTSAAWIGENKLWDKIGKNKCKNRPEIEAHPIGGYYSVLFGA